MLECAACPDRRCAPAGRAPRVPCCCAGDAHTVLLWAAAAPKRMRSKQVRVRVRVACAHMCARCTIPAHSAPPPRASQRSRGRSRKRLRGLQLRGLQRSARLRRPRSEQRQQQQLRPGRAPHRAPALKSSGAGRSRRRARRRNGATETCVAEGWCPALPLLCRCVRQRLSNCPPTCATCVRVQLDVAAGKGSVVDQGISIAALLELVQSDAQLEGLSPQEWAARSIAPATAAKKCR